ncbi:unnamed protein product [Eruca vesicaria subsp. sativa]|uniref:Uncharacterized protein n=1 Tax=Eruca vesicaria subsp. sativa TaxID=29727 RepID=A0ABC8LVM2_ERUVS|nr:unnamed protein product [Eruca vesicaria subsp. sativa]
MEVARQRREKMVNYEREWVKAARQASRASREGKREVAEVRKNHTIQFEAHFENLKETYKTLRDYRECRGSRIFGSNGLPFRFFLIQRRSILEFPVRTWK